MSADVLARGMAVQAKSGGYRGRSSVVILGDSITEQLGYHNVIANQFDISYFAWANAWLGGRLILFNNAGLGSTKTTFDPASSPLGMGARLQSEVIAYKPDWCFLLGGANDVNGATDDSVIPTVKANISEIIRRCAAAGIRMAIGTIMPTLSANTSWTTARVYRAHQLNSWIRNLPGRWPGLVVLDFAAALVNPMDASGFAKATMLQADDGIHPTQLGAYTMGKVVYDALTAIVPPVQGLVSSVTDVGSFYSTGCDQLFPKPLFSTVSGGTNSTSGVATGTVPGSLTLAKTGTWGSGYAISSVVARADGFGNDWQIVVTNTGANDDNLQMTCGTVHTSVAAGDVLVATCAMSATGLAGFKGAGFVIEGSDGVTTSRASALERGSTDDAAATADKFVNADMAFTLRTGPYVVPAGLTSLKLYLRPRWAAAGGTGTIRWGRVGLFRVPAYPAAS